MIVSEDVAHFAQHFVAALLVSIIPVPLTAPRPMPPETKLSRFGNSYAIPGLRLIFQSPMCSMRQPTMSFNRSMPVFF
ncbi:hypothetical protein P4S72_07620 [Vibrio sp. PP-XX7]